MHIVFATIFMVICLSERIIMNKNKNTIHNQKHLTLTERTYIEQELVQGSTFSSIASVLHKDPSSRAQVELALQKLAQSAHKIAFHVPKEFHMPL